MARTAILVTVFLLLLVCYFNLNYIKERIRSFSIEKEDRWLVERNVAENRSPYYPEKETVEITSPVFNVDSLYQSFKGPYETFFFKPDNSPNGGMIWLTDYSIRAVDESAKAEISSQFIGHNNLDAAFSELIPQRTEAFNSRLLMLAQGQTELHFPRGFGLPLLSHDNISVTTRVVNYNFTRPIKLRQKVSLQYVRDQKLKVRLKPLFKRTINILVGADTCLSSPPSGCCDSGRFCRRPVWSRQFTPESINGNLYTGHWFIPAGTDTVKYDVTSALQLPYATTLHYANAHVFPYCVSLTLRDITAKRNLFVSQVKNFKSKPGIENIDFFSSVKGIEMLPQHRYELICVTDNTTGKPQEMIAGMIVYFNDKELEKRLSINPQNVQPK